MLRERGTGSGVVVVERAGVAGELEEKGEAKKAWVLLADVGGDGMGEGGRRAAGLISEKEEAREEEGLIRLRWERGDDSEVDEAGDQVSSIS